MLAPRPQSASKTGATTLVLLLLLGALPAAPGALAGGHGSADWHYGARIPEPMEGMMGDWLDNDTYLMAQGHNRTEDVNRTFRFELATNQWFSEPDAPTVRAEGVGVVVDGILYSIGGRGPSCGVTCDEVEAFNPANGTWWARAPMPVPVAGMGGVAVGDDVWILGGRDGHRPTSGNATNLTWVYNTTTDAWSPGPPMPEARSEAQATVLAAGRIWVVGGYNTTSRTPQPGTMALDLATMTWSLGPNLNQPRYAAIAGRCGDDKILVAGGITGGADSRTRTNSTEWLHLSPMGNWTYGPPMPGLGSEFATGGGSDPTGRFVMAAGSGIHGQARNQTFVLDCLGDLDPENYPDYPLDGSNGDQPPPPPPAQSCDGEGSIAGNVTSNLTNPGTLVVRAMKHDCPPRLLTNLTGDLAAGVPYNFTGVGPGQWQVEAWLDNNTNGNIDSGEPVGMHPHDDAVFAEANRTDVHVHIPDAPPPPPPSCVGTGSIGGDVTSNLTGPGQMVVRVMKQDCPSLLLNLTGDFTQGVPFSFGNLSDGQYQVEAWFDDGDQNPEPGEPFGAHPPEDPVFAEDNRNNVHLVVGEGGNPPPFDPDAAHHWAGLANWTGAAANATIRLFNETNQSRQRLEVVQVEGPFNLSGLHLGLYRFEAWIEQDNVGGPGPDEPRGFLVNQTGQPDANLTHVDLVANVTDAEIVFVDAPSGGWPPPGAAPDPLLEGLVGSLVDTAGAPDPLAAQAPVAQMRADVPGLGLLAVALALAVGLALRRRRAA